MTSKLAILGTNYFNIDIAQRSRKMGYETHMFGVEIPAIYGKPNRELQMAATNYVDKHHELSVVFDKGKILDVCKELDISGVISIGSDATVPCVAYLADNLGLPNYNTQQSARLSTNKFEMKKRFKERGIPTTDFIFTDCMTDLPFSYPVVVKCIDRAGKVGITRVDNPKDLKEAIAYGIKTSVSSKKVLVEKYAQGKEWSVEAISFNGRHHIMTFTEKFSAPPHFVEEMHLQPAPLPEEAKEKISHIVQRALDALEIKFGPSHTELRMDEHGNVNIIEIAARIVADEIWQCVLISTGMDWAQMALDIAIGKEPDLSLLGNSTGYCGISRFIMSQEDHDNWEWLQANHPEKIVNSSWKIEPYDGRDIVSNGQRYGYYVMKCSSREEAIELAKPVHFSN